MCDGYHNGLNYIFLLVHIVIIYANWHFPRESGLMLFKHPLDFLLCVCVGHKKKMEFSAVEPISPAILTGAQVNLEKVWLQQGRVEELAVKLQLFTEDTQS